MRGTDWIVGSRRKPQEGLGEPLFDEWWLEDQRLFQDSVAQARRQSRARAPAQEPGQAVRPPA